MVRILNVEQEDSLAFLLKEADANRGDTAELDLLVGVRTSQFGAPSVAFCPSIISNVRIVRLGTWQDHRQCIPPVVQFSNNLRRRIWNAGVQHGFVRLRGILHIDTHIQICGSVTDAEHVAKEVCVHMPGSYEDYRKKVLVK